MTSTPHTVLSIFGTRPEAIKFAPVLQTLNRTRTFRSLVAVTAQHREMLDQVLSLFAIEPDIDLNIHQRGQTLGGVMAKAIAGLDRVVSDMQIDLILVQGDTSSTLAGALVGFYHQIPVAHIEAGLRTGNIWSPYPEEMNRRLITQLAQLHLAPTPRNVQHLMAEAVEPSAIVCTGNTVIDALNIAVSKNVAYSDPRLEALDTDKRKVILVTVHRREAIGAAMARIGRAIASLASVDDFVVVLPLHRNPLVRETILPLVENEDNVILCEPLPYGSFSRLLNRADLVLTDSGGIQEEAPSLGKPVLVLRDTTERPEAIDAGTVLLVGTDEAEIVRQTETLLRSSSAYIAMARAVNPYGDGHAAARVVQALLWHFGHAQRPADFAPEGSRTPTAQIPASLPNP